MFALRSIAQSFQDRGGSSRNIGSQEDGGEEGEETTEPRVEVLASKVKLEASVKDETFELLKGNDIVRVHQALVKSKKQSPGTQVSATVELEAQVGFSGENENDVSSAVKTTSFLFEQLLGDIEALSHRPSLKGKQDRQELVESFHAHMSEVMQSIQSAQRIGLDEEFDSAEAILAKGAEEYISSIRALVKKDFQDNITVWYRGLKYDAHVPVKAVENTGTATVGSMCYNLSFGPVVNALHACKELLCPPDGSEYERLGADARSKFRTIPVLKDISGVLRHGRLTLVLGPPGSGKTSYLKAVSGKLHFQKGVNAQLSGEVRYNYFLVEQLRRITNWSTYVSQIDQHLPLLTVRETLEFAWKCRKLSRLKNDRVNATIEKRLGKEAAARVRALEDVEVDFILAVLGLANCADTIIGNETLKGISGGEKRRVTLGEMLVTGANVVALDEISTGLDSAATYDICKYLSACSHFLDQVIAVALLQPPPEVIELFDDIVLLAEGNVIFHGPREDVTEYFEKLGYRCPPHKDFGDYLQELPTPSGEAFMMTESERDAVGAPKRPPRTADEFGQAWKQSQEGQHMFEEVSKEAQKQFEREEARLQDPDPESLLTWDDMPVNGFWTEFRLVLAWSWSLKLRNKAEIMARIFQNIFMGCIFGSLFWQIGFEEWYLKAMLFSQMPSFMQAGAIGAVTRLVDERDIMYKHTEAKFYSATTFALSQVLVQIPFTIFDAFVFGNLLYWMCGLVPDVQRYLVFMSLAVLFGLAINQLMRLYSYAVKSRSSAFVFSVLSYLLFLIFSGMIATPNVIPAYLKWFFWINPLAWVYRAMAINEFKATKYGGPGEDTCNYMGKTIQMRCGDFFLNTRQFETDERFVSWALLVLSGYLVVFLVLTIFVISKIRFDRDYTTQSEDTVADEDAQHGDGQTIVPLERGFARTESMTVAKKSLVFSDLWYTVNLGPSTDSESNSVDLLKGVSGWAVPGRMTALMGSSGAGKTTLLDVLADRKTTGTVTGHILVNGVPPDRKTFRRMVGYVEQFGVHANQATVKESLLFSAALRLPENAKHKVDDFVNETMELLELDTIQDELASSLSVEENKRLTIAVELVANPSILFADEPTSGLDARAASIVMRCIQNVARSGRTVICTIHQPSIAVFSMFDDLLLMRRGGAVVFFGELGENSKNLIRYFEGIPGTPPCPHGYNPATWMLEVIGAGTARINQDSIDYAAVYRKSKLAQENRDRLKYEFHAPESRDTPFSNQVFATNLTPIVEESAMEHVSSSLFSPLAPLASGESMRNLQTPLRRKLMHQKSMAALAKGEVEVRTTVSFVKQVSLLLARSQKTYWRSPEFSLSRLLVILFVGLIITGIFWQQEYATAADIQSRVSAISFMITLGGAYNLYTIMPFTIERRALFYRERSSGMYSALASVASDGIVELPYLVLETIIGVNVVYWGVGFNGDFAAYLYYSTAFFLYILMMTSLGIFFAQLMPDGLSAQLSASVLVQIFQLFAGTIVPHDKLPAYYKFLYYFSPQMWCTSGLVTTQFHNDNTTVCIPFGKVVHLPGDRKMPFCTSDGHLSRDITGAAMTAEDYVFKDPTKAYLHGYQYEDRYYDLLVLLLWVVLIRVLTSVVVVFVNHNKR